MNLDRLKDEVGHPAELQDVLEKLEAALAGLDRLDLKVVAARLSMVIEDLRGLASDASH